jgi:hypothetical protein
MIERNLVLGIVLVAIGFGTAQAQSWSDDVQVGDHTGIINVELEFDWYDQTLFAVVCWAGDGCTSYISTNYGDSWQETYSEGPGATVNDISCVYLRGYYYVVLSTPLVSVLYRFDAETGAKLDFGTGTPYLLVTTAAVDEIVLEAPEPDQDHLYFSGHTTAGQIFLAKLIVPSKTWEWHWTTGYCDRGYDAVTYFTQGDELHTMISCISGDDYLYMCRYLWGSDELWFLSSHTAVGLDADYTALAAAIDSYNGLVGDSLIYCSHDVFFSTGQLRIGLAPLGMATYVDNPAFSTRTPVLKCIQDWDVALAYVHLEGTGPHAAKYGRFRLHEVGSGFGTTMTEPVETYTGKYVNPVCTPDIEYLWADYMWGLLFAQTGNSAGNHAYFTKRFPGCCYGITGNVDDDLSDIVDIGDLTALIAYLYIPPNPEPPCMDEGNIDGDTGGLVDIGDLTALIGYLYIPPNPQPAACP